MTVTAPIQINDGQGNMLPTPENVVITINGADDNPVARPDTALVLLHTTFTADAAQGMRANDSDPDIHDNLTVSTVSSEATGQNGAAGQTIKGAYGSLTFSGVGSYSYIETASNVPKGATDVFDYTVSDGQGGTATSTLTINVTKDAGPEANPDVVAVQARGTVQEDAAHGVRANDLAPDNYPLSVTQVSFGHTHKTITSSQPGMIDGTYGDLSLNSDGSYTYQETATKVPVGATDVFAYTVSDGHDTAASTLTFDINASFGVDYSAETSGMDLQAISTYDGFGAYEHTGGTQFIATYLGTSAGYLRASDIPSIGAANFSIVSIFEKTYTPGYQPESYFTTAEADSDVTDALKAASEAGQTGGAIYFAVDPLSDPVSSPYLQAVIPLPELIESAVAVSWCRIFEGLM